MIIFINTIMPIFLCHILLLVLVSNPTIASADFFVIFVFMLKLLLQLMPGHVRLKHVRVRESEYLFEQLHLLPLLIYYFLIISDLMMIC